VAYSPQKGDVEVSLSVWGSLITETPPASLPEGVSPDNADVDYVPGAVFSRAALQKVFPVPFPAGGPNGYVPTIVYGKTFITPLGDVENLYFDSNGILYWEDVTNAPGSLTRLGAFAPGSFCKSITAFGREYIAISDGLHGSDVPLQWDGVNLDRVTQDGPGAPPTVSSIALPSVSLQTTGAIVLHLSECDPASPSGGYFTTINLFTLSSITGIKVGDSVTVAGYTGASAPMNGAWPVLQAVQGSGGGSSLLILGAYLPSSTVYSTAPATGTVLTGTLVRKGNTVTANCVSPHGLKVGYQAQISNIVAAVIGTSISYIVIDNENNPGIATVTTATPHGLVPEIFVNILGVQPIAVGTAITAISFAGGIVTVTTSTTHGLTPGAVVGISGTTNYNAGAVAVAGTPSPTTFTYAWNPVTAPAAESTGSVSLTWPVPDTQDPSYFQIQSCPTATSFQVAVTYSDGTWLSGIVAYPWDGTFYVAAVPTPTTFQYQHYGPDASSSTVGTATPFGQAAPGIHQCQVLFLTRNGYVTAPSPPVQWTAPGGQYVSISNIPIGPGNVVARILAFTGADGDSFFYIPATPEENGQVVGTPTQINDNSTTSVTLDFSDPTLFQSLGIDIPGNDLAAQIVIDGALGFGLYASRLFTWGQRNRIQNLLNMGFDGGYFLVPSGGGSSAPGPPAGWTYNGTGNAIVYDAHFGIVWDINVISGGTPQGSLSQSMFEDAYGDPIATPNTPYSLRVWLQPQSNGFSGLTFFAVISSFSTGFTSQASIPASAMNQSGSYCEAQFSLPIPDAAIPADLILTIYATNGGGANVNLWVDDLSIIYAQTPYTDTVMNASYPNNPEAFDGVAGVIGSTQDQRKIMDFSDIRQTAYFLTQDPSGRLHEFSDNAAAQPVDWEVREVAANCGLLSAFALTKSQADDSSSAGGEEWFAWASYYGARIFGGDQPWKISQEIEPTWEAQLDSANPAGLITSWALNDPVKKMLFFGMPAKDAPSIIFAVSYRQLDTAYAIGNTGPVRIGFSGRLIATDHSRKWTRWRITANGAALMVRSPGSIQPVFFGGNGQQVGNSAGFGNVYVLNQARYTDDDYGQIRAYYTTAFLPSKDQEEATQMGGYRKLLVYVISYATGLGNMVFQPLVNQLGNAWPITAMRQLSWAPNYDMEFAGCSAQGNRIALRIESVPNPPVTSATDNSFNIQRLTAFVRKCARLPVRGAA